MYSLDQRDRQLVNKTFDDLHDVKKLSWTTKFILFNYSLFCVWKIGSNDERKDRVVVDVRELNAIT